MRTEIRYPPEPHENETRIEWERRALRPWRMEEKARLLRKRGYRCERCEKRPVSDLDESIVPRCDMMGLSLEQRRLAFGTPNLTLSCQVCNRERAHDQAGAFERACQRYGEQRVREWYASLCLRAPRHEFLPKH